jgi:hypothetical protein
MIITTPQITFKLGEIPGFKNMILNREEDLLTKNSRTLKFNAVTYTTKNNNKYRILRYDKDFLCSDIIHTVGLLRSLVIDSTNEVVSFSPPKSFQYDAFINNNPEKTEYIIAEELVEGFMINVFWDKTSGLSGSWEFATRNTVGGEVCFFKANKNSKTFREMFLEAMQNNNFDLNMLNPAYCYSFVLQHPDNCIVFPFKNVQLYLVEVYEIVNTSDGSVNIFTHDLNIVKECAVWNNVGVKFPKVYDSWNTYEDLKTEYGSMNSAYDILGVVIKNKKTNERCKLRNPVYEYIKHLKGEQPKTQYQYLALRKNGKVGEFLKQYPEHKKDFSYFRDNLHEFTNILHQNYLSCYIKKEKPLKEFQDHFRRHIIDLHKLYMDSLRLKKLCVNNTVVIKYVNNLPTSTLMYSLNACLRKRRVDFIKVDCTVD